MLKPLVKRISTRTDEKYLDIGSPSLPAGADIRGGAKSVGIATTEQSCASVGILVSDLQPNYTVLHFEDPCQNHHILPERRSLWNNRIYQNVTLDIQRGETLCVIGDPGLENLSDENPGRVMTPDAGYRVWTVNH